MESGPIVLCLVSCVQLFMTPRTVTHQAPLSMGFSRQEYWSELPCPPPGDLLNPGIKPNSPTLQLDPLLSELPGKSKKTRVGCHALLQGIFSIQGLNPDLPHCRWILYCLSHQGSPRMLDWIVYPFSRGSFQPRNRTGVSCIAGRFFTSCATREAHPGPLLHRK